MNVYIKLFTYMMLIQVPIATLIDFGLMNMWGLSPEMLALAWVAVIGVNSLAYWAGVYILRRRGN